MFELLNRMVYNRLATATMRNQMTQAETYISTPNSSNDYTYTYDALGNVQVVYKASGSTGQEAYFFTQDAFDNELSGDADIPVSNRTNLFGSTTWATGRSNGITEHQTGKIASAFTGIQYFHARWYDPFVGRFVGRDAVWNYVGAIYTLVDNNPVASADPSGKCESCGSSSTSTNGWWDTITGWWDEATKKTCLDFGSYTDEKAKTYPPSQVFSPDNMGRKKHCYTCCMISVCFRIGPIPTGDLVAIISQIGHEIRNPKMDDWDSIWDTCECAKGLKVAPRFFTMLRDFRSICIDRCGGDSSKDIEKK
ncbi:MAG: hypothetical protein DYH02_06270 [Candidatus Omnitrophica bacterium COP1]|nr:hypothetical protein [Candidatus Omnitrophica bacterium COP1]